MSGISKRVSGSWVSGDYGIMKTATDTITTLPAVLYPNDITATVGLKGNMEQTGTPTPQNPIQPSECGDLETVGEKAGQYKIPISSASTTTPVYLGEVQTERKICKLVLTGQETTWNRSSAEGRNIFYNTSITPDYLRSSDVTLLCTHYVAMANVERAGDVEEGKCALFKTVGVNQRLYIADSNYSAVDDFKTYLQQQYANGTPVTVWYILATPETGIVNEPIRKIGDYADTVSGITIPTIAGANSFDVLTTLKPSEVTVNYKGWHPVTDVHERENGAWD